MPNTIPFPVFGLYGDSRVIRGGDESIIRDYVTDKTEISNARAKLIVVKIEELLEQEHAKLVAGQHGEISSEANPFIYVLHGSDWCYHLGDTTLYIKTSKGCTDSEGGEVEFRFAAAGARHQEIMESLDRIIESTEN
jgi:hypothetical protein